MRAAKSMMKNIGAGNTNWNNKLKDGVDCTTPEASPLIAWARLTAGGGMKPFEKIRALTFLYAGPCVKH